MTKMTHQTPAVLVVQNDDKVPLGRFEEWKGFTWRVVRAHHDEPLPSLRGFDGVVVLGGSMNALDPQCPWLVQVRHMLTQCLAQEIPTLGICLGGQLLALAAGAHVQVGDQGPEIGALPVTLTSCDDVFLRHLRPLVDGGGVLVPQSHEDAIVEVPASVTVLASSALYPHQLLRCGPMAWGTQYHPEVTQQVMHQWLVADTQALQDQGRTVEDAYAQVQAAEDHWQRLATAHLQAFAQCIQERQHSPGGGGDD